MADISQLAARIGLVRQNVRVETTRVVKEVAKEILDTLVENTPVDTSQALSNWQVSIGSRITANIPAYSVGKFGSTRSTSENSAKAAGDVVIQSFTLGQAIHIANNLPYIEGLNDGTISRQPSGFVQKALLIGRDHLNQVKVSL